LGGWGTPPAGMVWPPAIFRGHRDEARVTRSSCTTSSPRWVLPSKPMWSTPTRSSRSGSTGQPGRQLAPSSAAVTGSTVAPAGAGGALADDDAAADGDGVADGDGAAARGGSAAVHCTSTTPAAIIAASTPTRRVKDVNWDESSPLASIPTRPLRSAVSLDKSSANATVRQISAIPPCSSYLNREKQADEGLRRRRRDDANRPWVCSCRRC